MNKAYLNWSSGKDSALALYYMQNHADLKIEKLLTTINKDVDRVTMHGVRKDLLLAQSKNIGFPIEIIELDAESTMQAYNEKMREATNSLIADGFSHSIFGDIFLEDLKKYREDQLENVGLQAIFPLWQKDTKKLIEEFINLGFKAIVVCTNSKYLEDSFCGRMIDHQFIADLPQNVDPCGENGEFHTFVFDGPIFEAPVAFEVGEKISRSYQSAEKDENHCFQKNDSSWDTEFCFCDLLLK